jgi:hypothetical protein
MERRRQRWFREIRDVSTRLHGKARDTYPAVTSDLIRGEPRGACPSAVNAQSPRKPARCGRGQA